MNPARLILLSVALLSAVAAGYLALNISEPSTDPSPAIRESVQKIAFEKVLVASSSLPIGSRLSENNLDWQDWPEDAISEGFITSSIHPEAVEELSGSIVRLPIFANEPIREGKLVGAGTRIMSSILPAGKRAVATEITVATGAGGFILPNDRVDVIMVRTAGEAVLGGAGYVTETVLSNIRVLAIDQNISEDEDGGKTVLGSTATLELTQEQAKIIAVAEQVAARLTLALRSVADVQESDTGGAVHLLSGDSGRGGIQLIRSGDVTIIGTSADQIRE